VEAEPPVRWDPNIDDGTLVVSEGGVARLILRAHPNDADRRPVEIGWTGAVAARMDPPNDEARSGHPLYQSGLRKLLWMGEVRESHLVWQPPAAPAPSRGDGQPGELATAKWAGREDIACGSGSTPATARRQRCDNGLPPGDSGALVWGFGDAGPGVFWASLLRSAPMTRASATLSI